MCEASSATRRLFVYRGDCLIVSCGSYDFDCWVVAHVAHAKYVDQYVRLVGGV